MDEYGKGYICINRKTKAKIQLMRLGAGWHGLDCMTHQWPGPAFLKRSEALREMRHPWEWCPECKKVKEKL